LGESARDDSLVPTTVEEALRFDPHPGIGMQRFLTEDLQLADQTTLPAGATSCVPWAPPTATRPPIRVRSHGPDPDPNAHLSFGVGPHSCIGQPLARTELQVALRVLLRRLPGLRLAVEPDQLKTLEGLAVGGFSELPVRW